MVKALSTSLIGKLIIAKPEFGNPTDKDGGPNYKIWSNLKPNASDEYIATIDAAWTEDGAVKIAVHDVHGNTAEMYYTLVNFH